MCVTVQIGLIEHDQVGHKEDIGLWSSNVRQVGLDANNTGSDEGGGEGRYVQVLRGG